MGLVCRRLHRRSLLWSSRTQLSKSQNRINRQLLRRLCTNHTAFSGAASEDRKSTRLNSSHGSISYAVFCLKKKRRWPRHCAGVGSGGPCREVGENDRVKAQYITTSSPR